MAQTVTETAIAPPLVLGLRPALDLSDDQLLELCALNGDLRIERTREGDLVIMPPAGAETGREGAELTASFVPWSRGDGTGVVFGSSAGFRLPNGAVRAPDVSWVERSRWEVRTPEQRGKFVPLCPDFVLELRSPSDRLSDVQAKMQEYMENGARLGWLIDPLGKKVYIYRPGAPVETLENPRSASGDPVLPGFVLDLAQVWPR